MFFFNRNANIHRLVVTKLESTPNAPLNLITLEGRYIGIFAYILVLFRLSNGFTFRLQRDRICTEGKNAKGRSVTQICCKKITEVQGGLKRPLSFLVISMIFFFFGLYALFQAIRFNSLNIEAQQIILVLGVFWIPAILLFIFYFRTKRIFLNIQIGSYTALSLVLRQGFVGGSKVDTSMIDEIIQIVSDTALEVAIPSDSN